MSRALRYFCLSSTGRAESNLGFRSETIDRLTERKNAVQNVSPVDGLIINACHLICGGPTVTGGFHQSL